ncbi:lipoprotein [Mycoplasma capricolum subsp. capricolum]|uniref:lipoprotein n=1 Tax=Mycoplasma capricolum TaxID=2095 RepID=UPI003DA264DF
MKKLLALLGSVGLVVSTAAVAVACEDKPFTINLGKEKPKSKPTNQVSEKVESAPQADQPIEDKSVKETKKKEIDDAKEAVKKAKEKLRLANRGYVEALKKGDTSKKETIDQIHETEKELTKSAQELKEAEEKLKKIES